jgi:putative nucleotidyltransferase with HDIG domain
MDYLIVDDSAAIRKILQHMLQQAQVPVTTVYEAGDGVEALALLKNRNVNVIFSDIDMPNMDGLQFVTELKSHSARKSVPVIMIASESGQAKVTEAVRLGASGCLIKPFTLAHIKDKIVGSITGKIDIPMAAEAVAGEPRCPWALRTLPPAPPVVITIMSILRENDDDDAARKSIECIQADPVFAAEVLRIANLASVSSHQETTTIQRAVVTLSLNLVLAYAITAGMRPYLGTTLRIPALRSCWTHSLATALLSKELAVACRTGSGEAYTAGLLHDIGRIGLAVCYPAQYADLLSISEKHRLDVLQCERDLFDLDHCQAGAWIAGEWGLTPDIASAAEHHHEEPAPERVTAPTLAALGCRLAETLGFGVMGSGSAWTLEKIRENLPESAQNRFRPDAKTLKASVARQIEQIA